MFPAELLYNLVKLYKVPSVSIPEHMLEEMEFSHADKSNMNLKTYLWLFRFLGCPTSDIKQYMACYRRSGGSAYSRETSVTSIEPVPAHSTNPSYSKGRMVRAPSITVSGDLRNQDINVGGRV